MMKGPDRPGGYEGSRLAEQAPMTPRGVWLALAAIATLVPFVANADEATALSRCEMKALKDLGASTSEVILANYARDCMKLAGYSVVVDACNEDPDGLLHHPECYGLDSESQ
jgi:hypothetical protein